MLAFYSGYHPVTRADYVSAFQSVYPTVLVHDTVAEIAIPFSIHGWVSEISNNGTFSRFNGNLSSILEWSKDIVFWMVSVFEPLTSFNDYWFLSVFWHGGVGLAENYTVF